MIKSEIIGSRLYTEEKKRYFPDFALRTDIIFLINIAKGYQNTRYSIHKDCNHGTYSGHPKEVVRARQHIRRVLKQAIMPNSA
jgi:hypothetical protein